MPLTYTRTTCRLCGDNSLVECLSLGSTALANSFELTRQASVDLDVYPLDLRLCRSCGHVQLGVVVDPDLMFPEYLYVSGTSPVFRQHFDAYAEEVSALISEPDPLVVDIGSNDGTLLSAFASRGFRVQGVDPAVELAQRATEEGVPTIASYFTPEVSEWIRKTHGQADVVTANNVCAHVDNLRQLVTSVRALLKDSGIFVFEVSYLLSVVQDLLFDTVYHEHLDYHSVGPLRSFLRSVGLELVGVKRVDSHGGSIRCVAAPSGSRTIFPQWDPEELVALEATAALANPATYGDMGARIHAARAALRDLLNASRSRGEEVWGFGAPAKATTLMTQFGLDATSIQAIVDDSPLKQGRFMPGSGIRILAPSELPTNPDTAIIVLAWNFAAPIIARLRDDIGFRGTVITPLPRVRESRLGE